MPRPRFERLAPEKREAILEAAAQEFAAFGYAQASLNHILEKAGISKGAAYYYFDDKADLYMTAVQHYSTEIMGSFSLEIETLTADTFWSAIFNVYRQQFDLFQERPWVLGLAKSGGPLTTEELATGPLAQFWQEMETALSLFFQKGRELGVLRTDLADDLLISLVVAVDDAHDRWLFGGQRATTVDSDEAANRIVDLLQRLLSPAERPKGFST